ncbi:hypothetical protein CRUP_027216 [Coryphaenoides rupestris]|nr:hypothetical protein CRUP_027216 [Coryphaenoides rupestris]
MSRTEEVNKMTENVYKGILDQFNPSLKNFVTMGKHYEKALMGVTVAAKGYFDALVKLGELASDSQGSKELGEWRTVPEEHRRATLKKYQSERKSKTESIERCQSQLKKLRRKSQATRHPNKYGDREMQFVELMSRRQVELDTLVAVGYRSALTEERRRYCFLVDRQSSVTKVKELLAQKLSSWQQSCSQPTKLPERALNLLRHTAPQTSGGAAGITETLRHTKLGSSQHEQRLSVQEVPPLSNGDSNRSQQQQQQQQRGLPPFSSCHVSDSPHPPASPQMPRPPAACDGASRGESLGVSPQHTSTPLGFSPGPTPLPEGSSSSSSGGGGGGSQGTSTPTTTASGSSSQQSPLLLATGTSNLSPCLIPSTVLSLSQAPSALNTMEAMTLPISHSGPHSPPLPHSAPLSRAMTPIQLTHQPAGSGGSQVPSLNPLLMKAAEMYATSTLPLPRRPVSEMRMGGFQGTSLPRMMQLSEPLRVEALFAHTPAGSEGSAVGGACLLHFLPNDNITLLISEPRDGWHYGQNERTGRKGWFPYSYTQPHGNHMDHHGSSSLLLSKANSGSAGQLDKLVSAGLPVLTPESEEERSFPPQRVSTFRPRPYSMADSHKISLRPSGAAQGMGEWMGPAHRPSLSMLMQELSSDLASPPPSPTRTNPFAHVKLRRTVTNDRSAPIIE